MNRKFKRTFIDFFNNVKTFAVAFYQFTTSLQNTSLCIFSYSVPLNLKKNKKI